MHSWYLEGYFDAKGALQKQPLRQLPQILGRDRSLDCVVYGATIPQRHAQISVRNEHLLINDPDSRNGTFVNRERICGPTLIGHGDVIHLGDVELRLIGALHTIDAGADDVDEISIVSMASLSQHFPYGINDLETLIDRREILPVFQPIIGEFCHCELMGVLYYQGFHFSRPDPLDHFQKKIILNEYKPTKLLWQ